MSKSTRTAAPVTAAQFRARTLANPKAAEVLSAAALATLQPGARGRIHPEAIAFGNKGKRPHLRYVTGATKAVVSTQKAEAKAARQALEASGVRVGKRGPLPGAKRNVSTRKPSSK